MQLREAVSTDAELLLGLGQRLLGETDFFVRLPSERADGIVAMQNIIQQYASIPGWCMLNIWDGPDPVAEAVLSTGHLARTAHVGTLGIGVLRDYWAQGIGRTLMAALEAHAAAWHLERLEFTVLAHNHRARAFYRRLGYVEDGLRVGSVRYESDTLAGNVHYGDEVGMSKWIGFPIEHATADAADGNDRVDDQQE